MDIHLDRSAAMVMSPFGRRTRPFTDISSTGEDMVVGTGRTLPDLARLYYNANDIMAIKKPYAFIDRDHKTREYDPGREDQYMFSSHSSVKMFKQEAIRLLEWLNTKWNDLGFSSVVDKDRGIKVPDSGKIWDELGTGSDYDKLIQANRYEVAFILSNVDIMKKACIVRGVIPGWWASSYSGKNSNDPGHFAPSLNAHVKAIHVLETSERYKQTRSAIDMETGDPLDTNVGYPFYSASMDTEGRPVTRIQTLQLFKGIGTQGYDVQKLFSEVDRRGSSVSFAGYPFAIAPIRRLQYGYKWAPIFRESAMGLVTDHNERGNNTIRIAWIVPYLYNLILSPLQAEMKAARKMLPGCYHDGPAKKRRLDVIRKQMPWISEADYSNYDRFIPVDLILQFFKKYLSNKPHKDYWLGLIYALHHKMPIIWPDYVGSQKGMAWLFTPQKLGLMSGVKITSDIGTYINSIVNGQSLIDAGVMSESQLVDYLIQYRNSEVGSSNEYYFVQSDDTSIMSTDLKKMKDITNAFVANAKRAGLKGEATFADRFLMRSMSKGSDLPVPSRVWQNSLQNETPPDDPLKFMVGLAMRSDGLFGHKTVDPFGTSKLQAITMIEAEFSLQVVQSLLKFATTSSNPQRGAIDFLRKLEEGGSRMVASQQKFVKFPSDIAAVIDRMRAAFLKALADQQMQLLSAGIIRNDGKAAAAMLYQLHKDSHVPSQKLLLDQILAGAPGLGSVLETLRNKENSFYRYAMKSINIKTNIYE